MVPILLISHGSLAEGLSDAVQMITGPQQAFQTLALNPEEDPAVLASRIEAALADLDGDPGAGALVLVDLFGASPANAAASLFRTRSDLEIVAGVSLPMVLEVLGARESSSARDLARLAVTAGRESVRDVGEIVRRALAPKEVSTSSPCP
ncbi:MAG TPA: PTS sugar transporter subunit IIA [Candidatus Sulfotelmatobacter sp.]|nr:PTS sugar transporter subunit IIA [Candidatus Sulfotelmatobacter sp.]